MRRKLLFTLLTAAIIASLSVSVAVAGVFTDGSVLPEDLKISPLSGGEAVVIKKMFDTEKGILIFFNTSCKNCLTEIQWVFKEYPNANIHLVSIDINGEKRVVKWAQVYIKGVENPNIYLDPDFSIPPLFGFSFTPASVLIDKGGIVSKVLIGYNPDSEAAIVDFFK